MLISTALDAVRAFNLANGSAEIHRLGFWAVNLLNGVTPAQLSMIFADTALRLLGNFAVADRKAQMRSGARLRMHSRSHEGDIAPSENVGAVTSRTPDYVPAMARNLATVPVHSGALPLPQTSPEGM